MLDNRKWKDYPRGLRWFAYFCGLLLVLSILVLLST